MMIEVLACAEAEFTEAVAYYNQQLPGLGDEFATEVKAAFARLATFPGAWPVFSARSRRCLVNRFPYGVLYQVRQDTLLVLAIMHLHRDPRRWDERPGKATGVPGASPQPPAPADTGGR